MDQHLAREMHSDYICTKITRTIGMLHKTRFPVTNKSLLLLYYSLVYSYLIYCNGVLHIPLMLKESTCYREELFEQF